MGLPGEAKKFLQQVTLRACDQEAADITQVIRLITEHKLCGASLADRINQRAEYLNASAFCSSIL
jgi:hypothetical protein